jgi:hypothetical protein
MASADSWALIEPVEAGAAAADPSSPLMPYGDSPNVPAPVAPNGPSGSRPDPVPSLTDGQDADNLYQHAVERLARCCATVQLARAHLVYGEWLRRKGQRLDARERLRIAHQMFTAMEIEAFAQRAARELQATGEQPRSGTAPTTSLLTGQERQIARLAGEGLRIPRSAPGSSSARALSSGTCTRSSPSSTSASGSSFVADPVMPHSAEPPVRHHTCNEVLAAVDEHIESACPTARARPVRPHPRRDQSPRRPSDRTTPYRPSARHQPALGSAFGTTTAPPAASMAASTAGSARSTTCR